MDIANAETQRNKLQEKVGKEILRKYFEILSGRFPKVPPARIYSSPHVRLYAIKLSFNEFNNFGLAIN